MQISRGSLYGLAERTCIVSQYVGANTPVLHVYLKLYTYVDGMFGVVFTKLNFSSGNWKGKAPPLQARRVPGS